MVWVHPGWELQGHNEWVNSYKNDLNDSILSYMHLCNAGYIEAPTSELNLEQDWQIESQQKLCVVILVLSP